MQRLLWSKLGPSERAAALARPARRIRPELVDGVGDILAEIRVGGWDALVRQAERIDGAPPRRVEVAPFAAAARRDLPVDVVAAMELAAHNIAAFHRGSLPADHIVETMPGLVCRKSWRPLGRVGLYVPGGATPLFSTLLMLALPARAAGVEDIVVATPPSAGGLAPALALAAELAGIEAVWTVGGAQAIAALAFGAGPIVAVDKICGPGNAWVAEAKRQAAAAPGGPAIDMPAGPSELIVIADANADAATVAADLLSQAEHDPDAQVLLATTSPALLEQVLAEVAQQAALLPRREIVAASLAAARAILVRDLAEAVEVANLYAPEHLTLAIDDPEPLVAQVRNAGAVFAGYPASESFGDYLAGSSHVLPTDGAARAWSGVSALTFVKAISVQTVSAAAARQLAAPTALLARIEGLEAHARSAERRAA